MPACYQTFSSTTNQVAVLEETMLNKGQAKVQINTRKASPNKMKYMHVRQYIIQVEINKKLAIPTSLGLGHIGLIDRIRRSDMSEYQIDRILDCP